MKTRIYQVKSGEVLIEQSVSYSDGRGRKKWDKVVVYLDKKMINKIKKYEVRT
jgi:hypothetical protein